MVSPKFSFLSCFFMAGKELRVFLCHYFLIENKIKIEIRIQWELIKKEAKLMKGVDTPSEIVHAMTQQRAWLPSASRSRSHVLILQRQPRPHIYSAPIPPQDPKMQPNVHRGF